MLLAKENHMQISLAPLEGVTGYVVRNAFHHNFDGIDTFYTPFISAGQNLKGKVLRDILPENNEGITLIPQLMSNRAEDALRIGRLLAAYGYDEINLNIGCPSGTVTSKKRGSGLLTDLALLDHFLEDVFARSDMKISVKTRIGFHSDEEWPAILEIYKKYPIKELIIHPRVREEFYKGKPHLDCFAQAVHEYATIDSGRDSADAARTSAPSAPGVDSSDNARTSVPSVTGTASSASAPETDASPAAHKATFCTRIVQPHTTLCYNGDISSVDNCNTILERFPGIDHIMIGRGLISHPGLAAEIKYAQQIEFTQQTGSPAHPCYSDAEYRERIRAFHDEIYANLSANFSSEKDAMLHMKEIWGFLKESFAGSDKAVKRILKSQNCMEYKIAVNSLFGNPQEYPIIHAIAVETV
jgi:tRNA-dihydrouridine synthase